jgi:hypothetical protein
MDSETFMNTIDTANLRSRRILMKKGDEYTFDKDRLAQFKRTAAMEEKEPTETLFTMADKHISSIADMVKRPHSFTLKQWRAKLDDLRNYTLLLDALILDIGVE